MRSLDYDCLLNLVSELGCRLMESGAEIYRVEDSVHRLLQAYGVTTGEVFAIPNCVIVSVSIDDGRPLTRVRRVPSHGTDIDLLERYNALCRTLCVQTPPLHEALDALKNVPASRRTYSLPVLTGGYCLAGGAFCLFFGGTPRDAVCSALCAVVICLCLAVMDRMGTNQFFRTLVSATAASLLALGSAAVGVGENSDLIAIGALMLLMPGILFTTAMRDLMAGDTVSGVSKTVEALLIGCAIALGAGAALWLTHLLGR